MFQDIAHVQSLFHSVWPASDVVQFTAAGASDTFAAGGITTVTGNAVMSSGSWNYAVNFGGPTKASWTSGSDTDRAMHGVRHEGMFGTSFTGDSAYAVSYGGTGANNSGVSSVVMCQGNTTGTHPTWCK